MNRREMLVAALALPILSMSLSALAATPRITWQPGTLRNRHALMVARNLHQLIADGHINTTGEMWGMGHRITLSDPTFVVSADDTIWHPTRGFRYHDSLSIEFRERGFSLGRSTLYSMEDYEVYWQKPKPDEYPDFGVKALHTPYERFGASPKQIRDENWQVVETRPGNEYVLIPAIEAALGRDAVGFDDRWMKLWVETHKPKIATVSAPAHEDYTAEMLS